MATLVFKNAKTAEAYEALTEFDQRLEVPAGANCNCQNFSGWLSDIPPCAAKRYVDSKGNLIKKKEVAAVPTVQAAPAVEEQTNTGSNEKKTK